MDGDNKFERVSGTSIGGGTFWGLGKLLTKCNRFGFVFFLSFFTKFCVSSDKKIINMHSYTSFDELLELSHRGNNRVIDMLVGDIYGTDYSKVCLLL